MPNILKIGSPWLGVRYGEEIDMPPSQARFGHDCWFNHERRLQRRPSMQDAVTLAYVPRFLVPLNRLLPHTFTVPGTPPVVDVRFARALAVKEDGVMTMISSDQTNTNYYTHDPRQFSVPAHTPGVNIRTAYCGDWVAVIMNGESYLFTMNSSLQPYQDYTSTTTPPQMMVWHTRNKPGEISVGGIAIHSHQATPGYHYMKFRYEMRDPSGNVVMPGAWSDQVQIQATGTQTQKLQFSEYFNTTYGIATESNASSWSKALGWGYAPKTASGAGWKLYLQSASTTAKSNASDPPGVFYYAEARLLDVDYFAPINNEHIYLWPNTPDTSLTTPIEEWRAPSHGVANSLTNVASDVVSVGNVFVWRTYDTLYWGCGDYPYLAPPENWLKVDVNSYMYPLDDNVLAVVSPSKILLVEGLPNIQSVREIPLSSDLLIPGECWKVNGQYYGMTAFGEVVTVPGMQRISPDNYPTVGISLLDAHCTTASTVTKRKQVISVNRIATDPDWTTVGCAGGYTYFIRDDGQALWDTNDYLFILGDDLAKDVGWLWKRDGARIMVNKVTSNTYDSVGTTNTEIASSWTGSWQSCGTSEMKKFSSIEVLQEQPSQTTVQVELCDDPKDTGSWYTELFTFDQASMKLPINRTARYIRVKLEPISSQPWYVREVRIGYDIVTSRD